MAYKPKIHTFRFLKCDYYKVLLVICQTWFAFICMIYSCNHILTSEHGRHVGAAALIILTLQMLRPSSWPQVMASVPILAHSSIIQYCLYWSLCLRNPWWLNKESSCQRKRCGFDPRVGRSPGEGNGNVLSWRLPPTEEPGGRQSWGGRESDRTGRLNHHHSCLSGCLLVAAQGLSSSNPRA